jgi:hypothetical protein
MNNARGGAGTGSLVSDAMYFKFETPARCSTACGNWKSVVSVPSFRASTAITGLPALRGSRAWTKTRSWRSVVAASARGGASGSPRPQPWSPAATLAPTNACTPLDMPLEQSGRLPPRDAPFACDEMPRPGRAL